MPSPRQSGKSLLGATTKEISSSIQAQRAHQGLKGLFVALPLETCFQASFQSYLVFDFASSFSPPNVLSTVHGTLPNILAQL